MAAGAESTYDIDYAAIDVAECIEYIDRECAQGENCQFDYHRMGGQLQFTTSSDVITCCAANKKLLVFGTSVGGIIVLDHHGNPIVCQLNSGPSRRSMAMAPVIHIAVDAASEHVCTYSADGKVVVMGLYANKHNRIHLIGQAITTVACERAPDSPLGSRFIVGEGSTLTLFEEITLIKKLKATELLTGTEDVLAVSWHDRFVAWATAGRVQIYDLQHKDTFAAIDWEQPPEDQPDDEFRCNFYWSDARTLLIGWLDMVRICLMVERSERPATDDDEERHPFRAIIFAAERQPFYIAGLANIKGQQQCHPVVLGCPKRVSDRADKSEDDFETIDSPPMQWTLLTFAALGVDDSSVAAFTDTLAVRASAACCAKDFRLMCANVGNRFIIVSPRDVAMARLYETDERIRRLVERRKYEEAMMVALSNNELYAHNDSALWKDEVFTFLQPKQLHVVTARLPIEKETMLAQYIYEKLLIKCYHCDEHTLLKLLKAWPSHLYSATNVLDAVQEHFRNAHQCDPVRVEAMALLYAHQQDYERAVQMYLSIGNKEVFNFINRNAIYDVASSMINELIQLDNDMAFELLLDPRKLKPDEVVAKLPRKSKSLYLFLDALNTMGYGGQYDEQLVALYARYDQPKLLPLLRSSKDYSVQAALQLCKRKSLHLETLYLLGQMGGRTIAALKLIMQKIKDTKMAIDFCKEHDDPKLWTVLIDEAMTNTEMITQLLENMAGNANLLTVINRIKQDQQVPGLRQSLFKMLQDYRLRLCFLQTTTRIQDAEYFNMQAELVGRHQQGRAVFQDTTCIKCGRQVLPTLNNVPVSGLLIFECGHIYHTACATKADEPECGLCHTTTNDVLIMPDDVGQCSAV